ncbi:hypothetical protein M0805_007667 [Coniferiporia weirii]|nr:hypothetical protein M0805_007667 [Coniferiporia weirii]
MPVCPICPDRNFKSSAALRRHKIDSKKHYYCQSCAQDYTSYDALLEHFVSIHPSTTCGNCKKTFASDAGLQKHLLDSPKHPKCRTCCVGFRDRASHTAHKAVVHGIYGKRGKRQRPISPTGSIPDSSASSSSSSTWTPTTPPTSAGSPNETVLSPSTPCLVQAHSDIVVTKLPQHKESPASSFINTRDDEKPPSRKGSPLSKEEQPEVDAESQQYGHCSPTNHSSNNKMSVIITPQASPEPRGDSPTEEEKDHEKSTLEMEFTKHQAKFSSPLLDANVPLPSDARSDTSITADDDDSDDRFFDPSARRSVITVFNRDTVRCSSELSRGRSGPSLASRRRTSMLTEDMKASWRARCAAATSSAVSSMQSYFGTLHASSPTPLSRLPTIPDVDDLETETETDAYLPLIPEPSPSYYRPTGLRKRRLSLSPTLPSIPEAAHVASPVEPVDSDTESSLGIFEHHADDFLYDNLSENERCTTPLTYFSAGELEDDFCEGGDGEEDGKSVSERSCPSPPPLVIEDLTQLAQEMCFSPYDSDPFADPFNLHPSCTNSPINASFPKRPRAWSVGPPEPEPSGVAPAKEVSHSGKRGAGGAEETGEAAGGPSAENQQEDVIEDDLFSEAQDDDGKDENAEETEIEMVQTPLVARFAEEGHPLRKFISLESPKVSRQNSSAPLSPPPSPGQQQEAYADLVAADPLEEPENRGPDGIRMHCRLCYDDPCRDATATFCGHIFCYDCIAQEVMAKSKCPVCNAPTLLYCLFRLDLSS